MRTTLTILATAVGLMAGAPAISLAQKPSYKPPPGGWAGALDTTGLNLTADQTAKWRKIRDDLQQKNAPLREQARQITGGKSMRDLTPEEREKLRPKVQPIMDQMRENARKAREEIEAFLTPEQKAKMEQRVKERKQRGGGPPH